MFSMFSLNLLYKLNAHITVSRMEADTPREKLGSLVTYKNAGVNIIDLTMSLLGLRRVILVLQDLGVFNAIVWYGSYRPSVSSLAWDTVLIKSRKTELDFIPLKFIHPWIPGLLTNFKRHEVLASPFLGKKYPSFFFIENLYAYKKTNMLAEAYKIAIPTGTLNGFGGSPSLIGGTYPVNLNFSDNFINSTIILLIRNSLLYGLLSK